MYITLLYVCHFLKPIAVPPTESNCKSKPFMDSALTHKNRFKVGPAVKENFNNKHKYRIMTYKLYTIHNIQVDSIIMLEQFYS